MLKPKYTLTPEILTNLTQIERFYGQLEGLRIPKKLELNLERENLIQSSYVSNSIEGNPLSFPEVTNLLLNDRVPTNRDEKEIKNYFDLLKQLDIYVKKPLLLETVKEIHKKLMTHINDEIAGKIRNSKVVVGGYVTENGEPELKVKHEPPFHNQAAIVEALQQLLSWYSQDNQTSPVLKAGIFHHQYVYLHPFEDGNGRTCRLLTALIFLQNNYQINRYFVLDDYYDIDRLMYSDSLNSADTGDKTNWLKYFSDGVKYSLQSALSRVSSALQGVNVEDRPTNREQDVLEHLQRHKEATSLDIVKQFGVSRQQAHKLLSQLVEKGYLIKKGDTKGSYYIYK